MKTESEIYKACIDAGLKAGDIVRMSDGSIDLVLEVTVEELDFGRRLYVRSNPPLSRDEFYWPTHYARPLWEGDPHSWVGFCVSTTKEIPYPPPPDQKSIEERLAAIESQMEKLKSWGVKLP